jgi:hypothetical protein
MISMKKVLLALLGVCTIDLFCQIPNPDFESWTTRSTDHPNDWMVLGKVSYVTGFMSSRAAKIQRDPAAPQSPGALLFGVPVQGGINGGIPFSAYPDTLVGYFKLNLEAGDSGFVLLYLKKKGAIIGTAFMSLTGNDSANWVRLNTPIYYTDTGNSDTLVLGLVSNNPAKSFQNSWVITDSLHFSGGVTPEIPNGNFQKWTNYTRHDPTGWFSTNSQLPPGYPIPVSRSSDRVFGQYSARIQSVTIPGSGLYPGYVLAGGQGSSGPTPGFVVGERDTMFYFNYKFQPQNQDSMSLGILYYDSGTLVGAGFFVFGSQQNTWTEMGIPISYLPLYEGIPDSAAIFVAPFQGGENPTGESVVFVDGLKRNVAMNSLRSTRSAAPLLRPFPNPTTDNLVVLFSVQNSDFTEIQLTDANGKVVRTIFDQIVPKGSYTATLNVSSLPPGLYFCRLKNGQTSAVENIIISR